MGWDELMETLKKRFEEQKERHEGGSKMIGTGGTSPFGAYGYNPQGIRIGQDKAATRARSRCGTSAPTRTTTTPRNWARATSRWRCAGCAASRAKARAGTRHRRHHPQHGGQRRHAGHQDGARAPQQGEGAAADGRGRHDGRAHPPRGRALQATKTEFKHLEFYYFHNCVYDFMWKNNRRRFSEKFTTWDVIRKYNKDYKLIFVGDATMSPYEILQPGGSVEYNNEEPGAEWLQRLTHAFPKFAWINPEPQGVWQYRQSISIVQQLMNQRMFPLTLAGLEGAMRLLSK
jgi:uncharacterized protein with von Willebrand factor type A (vWA) domain